MDSLSSSGPASPQDRSQSSSPSSSHLTPSQITRATLTIQTEGTNTEAYLTNPAPISHLSYPAAPTPPGLLTILARSLGTPASQPTMKTPTVEATLAEPRDAQEGGVLHTEIHRYLGEEICCGAAMVMAQQALHGVSIRGQDSKNSALEGGTLRQWELDHIKLLNAQMDKLPNLVLHLSEHELGSSDVQAMLKEKFPEFELKAFFDALNSETELPEGLVKEAFKAMGSFAPEDIQRGVDDIYSQFASSNKDALYQKVSAGYVKDTLLKSLIFHEFTKAVSSQTGKDYLMEQALRDVASSHGVILGPNSAADHKSLMAASFAKNLAKNPGVYLIYFPTSNGTFSAMIEVTPNTITLADPVFGVRTIRPQNLKKELETLYHDAQKFASLREEFEAPEALSQYPYYGCFKCALRK